MAKVPQINSFGVYVLEPPFTIAENNYRCSSIQLLSALDSNDVDVYTQIYAPKGLSSEIYTRDIADDVAIITLVSDIDTVTVPSSYINEIPSELAVPTSVNVISLEVGLLPDNVDLSLLVTTLAQITESQVGNRPTVHTHRIPSRRPISVTESELMETARELRKGAVINFYNTVQKLQAENIELRGSVTALEEIVISLTPSD